MEINFLTVFIAVISLVILAVPGFILAKAKMFSAKADDAISVIVMYVSQPVLIFMSFQETYNKEIAKNIGFVALLSIAVHILMFLVIALFIKNKSKSAKIKTVRYSSLFGNCGYMGLPFLNIVFNGAGEIIIYAAIVIAIFNIFNWTLGVYMLSENKKYVSIKSILLNPTIISIIIGALYFFTIGAPIVSFAEEGTQLHFALQKIMASIDIVGDLVTPLSMTVIGIRLANVKLKELLFDKWAYVTCFFKLIIMSVLTILLVAFLPIDKVVKYVIFFVYSMPSATSTVMFSLRFGGDANSGSVFVLLSTIFSILTIPLMYLLMSGVFVPM